MCVYDIHTETHFTFLSQVCTSMVCTWTAPAGIVVTPACSNPPRKCCTPCFLLCTCLPSTQSDAKDQPCTSAPSTRNHGVLIWPISSLCCWRRPRILITGYWGAWLYSVIPSKWRRVGKGGHKDNLKKKHLTALSLVVRTKIKVKENIYNGPNGSMWMIINHDEFETSIWTTYLRQILP